MPLTVAVFAAFIPTVTLVLTCFMPEVMAVATKVIPLFTAEPIVFTPALIPDPDDMIATRAVKDVFTPSIELLI